MLAIGIALHVLLSRGAKALVTSAWPLASGEPEIAGYQRRVYGSTERAMLEVVALVLAAGVMFWVAMGFGPRALHVLGVLTLLGAVALDLYRWERVTLSPTYVWFQRGLRGQVHQVAIENIRDVSVTEVEARGFTLRHLHRNRACRLTMRMKDKHVVALPKTDAHLELEAVEDLANQIRSRQHLTDDRAAVKRAGEAGGTAAAQAAVQAASVDREMLRELKRLRQRATAPDVPPAVKR